LGRALACRVLALMVLAGLGVGLVVALPALATGGPALTPNEVSGTFRGAEAGTFGVFLRINALDDAAWAQWVACEPGCHSAYGSTVFSITFSDGDGGYLQSGGVTSWGAAVSGLDPAAHYLLYGYRTDTWAILASISAGTGAQLMASGESTTTTVTTPGDTTTVTTPGETTTVTTSTSDVAAVNSVQEAVLILAGLVGASIVSIAFYKVVLK
jgi:hypothetical protein